VKASGRIHDFSLLPLFTETHCIDPVQIHFRVFQMRLSLVQHAAHWCLKMKVTMLDLLKKGKPFRIPAKVAGEGKRTITKWFTIAPNTTRS